MPQPKGVEAFPWKHHAFCLTQEATFADVQRTIQLFIAHHKTCSSEQEYTEFSLAYSQLLNLPEELYKLTWLQKLALNYHRIASLSESIDKLQNLQYLYLDHNRLSNLPNAVSNLVRLKVLSLSYNKLKYLCPLGMLISFLLLLLVLVSSLFFM
jgi:Leucine-rich repeat (LRR) protein